MGNKDLRTRGVKDAMAQDQADAQDWAKDWSDLSHQRLAAAAKGESSPWLAMKQWGVEVPLNWNMRGYDADAAQNIEARDAAFEAEKERLMKLAEQKEQGQYSGPINPNNIWSRVPQE